MLFQLVNLEVDDEAVDAAVCANADNPGNGLVDRPPVLTEEHSEPTACSQILVQISPPHSSFQPLQVCHLFYRFCKLFVVIMLIIANLPQRNIM